MHVKRGLVYETNRIALNTITIEYDIESLRVGIREGICVRVSVSWAARGWTLALESGGRVQFIQNIF